MSTYTEVNGKVRIDKSRYSDRVTIIDTSAQSSIDWSKVRKGDRFIMTHPRGIGYSATYSYTMMFTVDGYRNGCIDFSETNGRMLAWSGYLELPEHLAKLITMENESDKHMSHSSDSYYLAFKISNIVEYRPKVEIDELGEKIDEVKEDEFYVIYEVNENLYKPLNVLVKGGDVERRYNRTRVAKYVAEKVEFAEWTGGKLPKGKYQYMCLHDGGRIFNFEPFDKYTMEMKYKQMLEDTWENEEYKKYVLINFKKTDKFTLGTY